MNEIYDFYFTENKIVGIFYDNDYTYVTNPRTDFDNLFTLYTWSNYYSSPDKNISFDDFFEDFDKTQYLYKYINIGKGYIDINKDQKTNIDVKGIAFVSKEDLKKEYNCKYITKSIIEKAFKVLDDEIELYNEYMTGNIFYVNSYSFFGEQIDGCSSFYGTNFNTNGIYDLFGMPVKKLSSNKEIQKIINYIESCSDERYILFLNHLKEKYKINKSDNIIEFYFNEKVEYFYEKDLVEELRIFFNQNLKTFSGDIKNFVKNNLILI